MKAYAQVRGSRSEGGTVSTSQPSRTVQNQNKQTEKQADTGPLFAVLFVVFILYAIVSGMLVYHWRRFAKHDRLVGLAQVVYFAVTILLLLVATFSLL
jgi:hypothetical protein